MDRISQEFVSWKKQESRVLSNEVNHENGSIQPTEKHVNNRVLADSTPLVVDVANVPSKIDGDIFQKSTGSMNLTALRRFVQQLNIEHTEPPE